MDSTESYEIKCINATEKGYYFAVYLTNPFDQMNSVAWQVTGVPHKGEVPSQSMLRWQLNFGVAMANWDEHNEKYSIFKAVDAKPGNIYEVVESSDDVLSIEPNPIGSAAPELLWLKNNTNKPLHLGFTINDKLIVVEVIEGGETFMYNMPTKYWVACFRHRAMQEGNILDTAVAIGPVQVEFKKGYTCCKVEAAVDGGRHYLKEPVFYSSDTFGE